jgi:hypothetical protein
VFRPGDITARLRARPFHPFRIVASEGLSYEIRHPELVMVGERDVAIGLRSAADPTVYDQLVRLALVHIVAMEDLPESAPASGKAE